MTASATTTQQSESLAGLPSTYDELVIETPERVELYYTRAQVGNRFLAAGVDHLIQFTIMFAVGFTAFWLYNIFKSYWEAPGQWVLAGAILLAFGIYLGYFAIFETIWNGQTPGKRLFRLRVIREDGRPIRFYEAMVRNLLRVVVDSMPIPLYSIGILAVFLSSRSKRVGDYVAGTVVIRESEARAPTIEDVQSLSRAETDRMRRRAESPFTVPTALLTKEDLLAIRSFLRRRYDLSDTARYTLANRIAASLADRLRIPPLALSAEQVIEEVDRQSRSVRFDDGESE